MANLIAVTHQQARLDYFRDQLAAAERRLDWGLRFRNDPWENAERAEVVAFYQWAVDQAKMECSRKEVTVDA